MQTAMQNSHIRKASHKNVPPLIDNNCRSLVLGSMLSPKSERDEFYYAHPQNRFWRTLSAVFGCECPTDKDGRSKLALSYGVALWDVIESCEIVGASDSTIKNVVYNDIVGLLENYPNITRIFTTGGKAYSLLLKYNEQHKNRIIANAISLPSTSPQNCKVGLSQLIGSYSILKDV